MKILSDHKGWVNGVAWAKIDPFSEVTANLKGNLATLASDRCLRVFNASTKNFKNIAKTHRCKLRVPVSRKKEEECIKDDESSIKVKQMWQILNLVKRCKKSNQNSVMTLTMLSLIID